LTFFSRSAILSFSGELLLDQGRFEEAIEKFDKATELEKLRAPQSPNVLPYVNKGLAMYQWKQDIGAAERCCNEALRIDPECEAVVATLAQLSLQQGKIEQAMVMFERQIELSRSELELSNALSYQIVRFVSSMLGRILNDLFVIGFSFAIEVYQGVSGQGRKLGQVCKGAALKKCLGILIDSIDEMGKIFSA